MVIKIPQRLGECLLELLRCIRLGEGVELHAWYPLHGQDAQAAEIGEIFREAGVGKVL